jgi:hypothetical protein
MLPGQITHFRKGCTVHTSDPAGLSVTSPAVASLDELRSAVAPVRDALLGHPLYEGVNTLPRLRVFMAHHVFAVWDFMCLAKRLQRDLTSLDELWLPPLRPSLARFINSVVHGEESDVDLQGHAASHFGLYLAAMQEVGVSTGDAERFIQLLRDGADAQSSLVAVGASPAVQRFVGHTLETVRQGTTVEVLASFLFGREDLIPEMFSRLLPQWAESKQAGQFAYYVERHIELDGDEHGPAGLRALAEMAAGDASVWRTATAAAHDAMAERIALCDDVHARLAEA